MFVQRQALVELKNRSWA